MSSEAGPLSKEWNDSMSVLFLTHLFSMTLHIYMDITDFIISFFSGVLLQLFSCSPR